MRAIILLIAICLITGSATGQSPEGKRYQETINKAQENFQKGDYGKVLEELNEIQDNDDLEKSLRREMQNLIKKSQESINCNEIIQDAFASYEKGKLPDVVSLSSICLYQNTLNRTQQKALYQLLIETYLFLDEKEKAQEIYGQLLKFDPFADIRKEETPELEYLRRDFETFPKTMYTFSGGIYLFALPEVTQVFSAPNTSILRENYTRSRADTISWTMSFHFGINLFNSHLYFHSGLGASNLLFQYEGLYLTEEASTTTEAFLTFQERHRWFQIPFYVSYQFIPHGKVVKKKLVVAPYVYTGVAMELLRTNKSFMRDISIFFVEPNFTRRTDPVNLKTTRNTTNLSFLIGGGIKFNFQRVYLNLDLQYNRMLRNLVDENKRFDNPNIVENFRYVDNDFKLDRLGLTMGIGLNLFKSKKK